MVRTQIQLTDEQWRSLRALATERGVSLSELVRQGVDVLLRLGGNISRQDRWERAQAAVGRFRSGSDDLSRDHDKHLAEALES